MNVFYLTKIWNANKDSHTQAFKRKAPWEAVLENLSFIILSRAYYHKIFIGVLQKENFSELFLFYAYEMIQGIHVRQVK